jgi:hypothetical protein
MPVSLPAKELPNLYLKKLLDDSPKLARWSPAAIPAFVTPYAIESAPTDTIQRLIRTEHHIYEGQPENRSTFMNPKKISSVSVFMNQAQLYPYFGKWTRLAGDKRPAASTDNCNAGRKQQRPD